VYLGIESFLELKVFKEINGILLENEEEKEIRTLITD